MGAFSGRVRGHCDGPLGRTPPLSIGGLFQEERDDSKLQANSSFPSASVSSPGKGKAAGISDSSRGCDVVCCFQVS